MDEIRKLKKDITKYTLLLGLVLSIASIAILNYPIKFILGLCFGSLIGILNFFELSNTLAKAVTFSPDKAQSFTTKKYFIRFILTAIVLYVSVTADHINVIGTIIGLLLIKVVIFATNLFNDKEYFKNIFRKEE